MITFDRSVTGTFLVAVIVISLAVPLYAQNPFITGRVDPITFGGGPGPENTLAAVIRSIELGLRFVEVDVRLTSDGKLVLMHDPTIDRVAKTKGAITEMTFAEARRLDVGSSFVEATTLERPYAGERVATPAEVITLTRGKATVLLDVKVPEAMKPVISVIDQANAFERVVFRVSDESAIGKLRAIDERAQIVLTGPLPADGLDTLLDRLKTFDLVAYTPDNWTTITSKMVEQFHDRQIAVWANGARELREMAHVATTGVDALFTETPTILRQIVRDTKKNAPLPPIGTLPTPIRIADVVGGHVHPAVCMTKGGAIIVVYNKAGGAGKELLLTRSTDRGSTWSRPAGIPSTTRCPVYPGSIRTLADGRILLTWTCYSDGNLQGPQLFAVSGDEGLTFGDPRSLGVSGFLRHPILELSKDRWLFPLRDQTVVYNTEAKSLSPFGDGRSHGRVPIVRTRKGTLISGAIPGGLRSTDNGVSWQPLHAFPRFHVAGYDLTALDDDSIVLTLIMSHGSRERSYHLVASHDDGRTWNFSRAAEIYNPGRAIAGRGWPRTVQIDERTLGTVFYDLDAEQPGGPGLFVVRTPTSNLR